MRSSILDAQQGGAGLDGETRCVLINSSERASSIITILKEMGIQHELVSTNGGEAPFMLKLSASDYRRFGEVRDRADDKPDGDNAPI